MISTLTLKMQANHGYVVTPDPNAVGAASGYSPACYSKLTVKSAVVCWVKPYVFNPQTPAPTFVTPTDPTPTAGSSSGWYEMAANETVTFGLELPFGGAIDNNGSTHGDRLQYLLVYTANGGDLVINAH